MIIFLAGDIHGELAPMYEKVAHLEQTLNVKADWVLQTGNLGVWPDPQRVDRHTKKRNKPDFHKYYLDQREVPRPTVFIAGKHEDHRWLREMALRDRLDILPNLTFLLNGYKTHIANECTVSIVGLGKVYSPTHYEGRRYIRDKKKWVGHYTKRETDKACSHDTTDILLTHEAGKHIHLGNRVSEADGITGTCHVLRPKLHVHGHYNVSKVYKNPTTQTPTISLAFNEVRAVKYEEGVFTLLGS